MSRFLVFFILVLCTYLSLAICNIWKLNFVVTMYRFIGLHVENVFDFVKFTNVFALPLTKLATTVVECGKAEKEIPATKHELIERNFKKSC